VSDNPTLFSLDDFVRPDAQKVIETRVVDVKKHTRKITPRGVKKPITSAPAAALKDDKLDENATVKQAREWLEARVEHGVRCPTCTRFAKIYTRTITASMARALMLLYKHAQKSDSFVRVDAYLMKEGVHSGAAMPALLRHWALVEKKAGKRKDTSSATGEYRITERGKLFVENKITVEKFVRLYDDQSLFVEGTEKISIRDALKKKFNYDELMKEVSIPF